MNKEGLDTIFDDNESCYHKSKVGLFAMVGDLLPSGHLLALKTARERCDKLIVALDVQPSTKQPIESAYERYVRLASCKYVDEIIPYSGDDDLKLICQTIDYDVRFVGADDIKWVGKEIEFNRFISSCVIDRVNGWSSTDLKNRIVEQSKKDSDLN